MSRNSRIIEYKVPHKPEGRTHLRWGGLPDGRTIAICTELEGNPSASITNAAEYVWPAAAEHIGLPVERLVKIEHYEHGAGTELDTFDEVLFPRASSYGVGTPQWRRLTVEELGELVGLFGKEVLANPETLADHPGSPRPRG